MKIGGWTLTRAERATWLRPKYFLHSPLPHIAYDLTLFDNIPEPYWSVAFRNGKSQIRWDTYKNLKWAFHAIRLDFSNEATLALAGVTGP